MTKKHPPQQIININPLPPEPPRHGPADWFLGCAVLIIAAGVALALIAGAIW